MSEKQIKADEVASSACDGDDLYNPAYTGALAESAQVIVEQNRHLLLRSQERSFNPVTELDFTSNGAGVAIQHLFEEVAAFREGCVPWRILRELAVTTDRLIRALKERKNAPVLAIDAVGVAFRECMILWCDTHSSPRMERKTYLKKIFKGKDEFCKALKALHAEYVRIAAAKGHKKRTMSAASILEEPGGADERNRIYREIWRLEKGGMTAKKAISAMMRGTYAARMKGVKAETWRRYYNDWKRHSATCKSDPINALSKTENSVHETVNPTCETINETINPTRETINETIKPLDETIIELIQSNPGVSGLMLVELIGKSRATIMRVISDLKLKGRIEYRGSKKTGGYYAAQSLECHHRRKHLEEQRDGTKSRKCGIMQNMTITKLMMPVAAVMLGGSLACAEAAQNAAGRVSCSPPPLLSAELRKAA